MAPSIEKLRTLTETMRVFRLENLSLLIFVTVERFWKTFISAESLKKVNSLKDSPVSLADLS